MVTLKSFVSVYILKSTFCKFEVSFSCFNWFYLLFSVCDYDFHQTNGSFTSPRFPLNYNENANCSYRITTDKSKVIVLRFVDFALENKVHGKFSVVENKSKVFLKFLSNSY